jgi:putative endonuclease
MGDRIYCAYIVASLSHTLYIGVTGNLLKPILEHKQRTHPGFSTKYNCNRLVWFERFTGPQSAIEREAAEGMDSHEENRADREEQSNVERSE